MTTTTGMSLIVLLIATLLFGGVYRLLGSGAEPSTNDPPYRPDVYSRGCVLPVRPEGLQSLKAEIAKATVSRVYVEPSVLIGRPPVRLVTAPPWTPRHRAPEWSQTDEHRFAFDDFFDGLPDDEAKQREWVGAGR